MTTDARHSKQTSTNGGVHTIVAFIYANETARLAATGFVPGDVGKVALDQDTNELSWLVDDDPITWTSFDAGATAQLNKVSVNARKSTAGTLTVGTVVCAKGYDEAGGYATIEAAKADSATTLPVVGVVSVECTDSTTGKVLVTGVLHNVDTSSFSAQAPLYISATTAGEYTDTPPSGPYVVQSIGVVLSSHATEGHIGVNVGAFRAIEYTTTPLIAGTGATGTANKASAHDHVHPTELIDEENVLYVGKHGNDANDGKTVEAAFLTFGAALAEALAQTPSSFNAFNIQCFDSGGYVEDFTVYSYCVVTAPAVTILGEVTLQDYARCEFLQVRVGAGKTAIEKPSGTGTSSVKISGITCTGSGNAIKNDGTDSVIIAELDYINVEDGDAIHDSSSGDGQIYCQASYIYIDGDGKGIVTAGGAGEVYAYIQEIEEQGAGTTTAIDVQTGMVHCDIFNINCDTAWSVAGGATLEAFIGSASGTTTETGTVNVTIAGEETGETNTASNVGTAGVGVYKQKTGTDLEFKKINAGSAKITITDDTGNDEVDINVVTGTDANSVCVGNDSRLSDSRAPTSHASSHDAGGGDAMAIDAVAGTGSLRTLGTSATSACAGNDSRLSDNRTDADAIHDNVAGEIAAITAKGTPTTSDYLVIEDAADSNNKKSITVGDLPASAPASHASSHNAGGGDALAIDAAAGTGSLRTLGTASTAACAGDDSRLSDSRAPTSHASTHDAGGGDAMAIDAVAGTGSLRTLGTSATSACAGNDSRLSDSRTPTSHSTSHENGGGDEISVAGLSGLLADGQTPLSHATSHQSGGADAIKLDDLASPDDNTDLDATTSAHGLLPKLAGGTTNYLRADGNWSAPATESSAHLSVSVRKASSGTITAGQVVYLVGWDAGGEVPTVELADASTTGTMPAFGVASESITNLATGALIVSGELTGQDTSIWSAGDELYVSETAGDLTTTEPTGTALVQKFAEVTRDHPTMGVIQVFGAGRTNDLPNLPENKVWMGNASAVPTETAVSSLGSQIKLDNLSAPDDNTDLDSTTSAHGLLPKLGGGTTNYLRADGTWSDPTSASGDVNGPASATDNAITRFDGTTGKTIQNSGIVIDDSDKVSGTTTLTFDSEYDNGNSGTSKTIDWNNGQKQKLTLTGNCTVTLTAPSAGVGNFLIKLVQDATANRSVTWPASVLWPLGNAPGLSNQSGDIDIVSFYWDGTNYFGVASLDFS